MFLLPDVDGNFNPNLGRIVGFLVEPISVQHKYKGEWDAKKGSSQLTTCYNGVPMPSMDSRRVPQTLTDADREVRIED